MTKIVQMLPVLFIALLLNTNQAHALGGSPHQGRLETVDHVDLAQYLGDWYEIARYENSFQRNCFGSTANYSLRDDGAIKVTNRCFKGSMKGDINEAIGKAWVTDKKSNAKLKVSFFWPFSGQYWIIDLGDNYEYAVVGEPTRKFLWILSRTPQLEADVYDGILNRLTQKGYDPTKLLITQQ